MNSSSVGLAEQTSKAIKNKPTKLPKLKTQTNNPEDGQIIISPTRGPKNIKRGYEIGSYPRAAEFLKTQMYTRKVIGRDGDDYQPYNICDDIANFKEYGLGMFLYLQFLKRLLIVFFVMSIIGAFPMYICYSSYGLSTYQDSYTLILAKFGLGNLYYGDQTQYLIVTICDIVNCIIFFIFYLNWRAFHNSAIEDMQKDHTILNPVTYALSVTGFNHNTPNLEQNLKNYFDGLYKGSYQVEIVYDYKRKFHYFTEYDEIIQKIQRQHQVINQTKKSQDDLIAFEKQQQEKQQQLLKIAQDFQPLYAIVHFRNLRAKFDFIRFCKHYSLINKFSSKLYRCFCCASHPPQNKLFLGNQQIMIESNNLSRPQQINWENLDISLLSRFFRMIFSVLLLFISLAIASFLIGLSTLYVASTSSCTNFDSTISLTSALAAGGQTIYCYCSQNYSFTGVNSADLQNACINLQKSIIITNLIQIVASIVSSITNTILIIIIQIIASFLYKPQTKPKQYSFIFIAVLICNFINSTLMPLLLNSDIFSFKPVSYLTFISFINTGAVSIFKDFDKDWYAIVSPYYFTFFIILCLLPWISLIVFWLKSVFINWWIKRKCENSQNKIEDPIIQKQANSGLAYVILDFPLEQASLVLYLLMCMMYTSLIPLLYPLFTLALGSTLFCKKLILQKFSLRVPANENLNSKTINILPFMLLIHCAFAVWGHTTPNVFDPNSYVVKWDQTFLTGDFARIFNDLLILGAFVAIAAWIIFDYTLVSFFGCLRQCCFKDQLDLPVQYAQIENLSYEDRLRKSNIIGSYKVAKHPIYGHAILAYKELLYREKRRGE